MKLLIYSIGLLILGGCNFNKSHYTNIPLTDRLCWTEMREADRDIKKDKLVYCFTQGMLYDFKKERNHKELTALLKKYNISTKGYMFSDLIIEGQTQGCYCGVMDEKIAEKHGTLFIDSIKNVADSMYVAANINKDFIYLVCDEIPNTVNDVKYADGGKYADNIQARFDRVMHYPTGYHRRDTSKTDYFFADIDVYVPRVGKAKVKSYHFEWDPADNSKFEEDIKKVLTPIIEGALWKPARIRKTEVNCNTSLRVAFE